MEFNRQILKAVSAEARLKMLKCLKSRKKMPSELSREIGLSPSTVIGHLKNLEGAGLIRRIETGHKWVYYELTDKGAGMVQPRTPIQFMLTFAIGVLAALLGIAKSISKGAMLSESENIAAPLAKSAADQAAPQAASNIAQDAGIAAAQSAPIDILYIALIVAGALIAIFSAYMIMRRNKS